MKTFDEAFEKIAKTEFNLMQANLKTSTSDLTNEAFKQFIVEQATEILLTPMKADNFHELISKTCSRLHIIFSLGQQIGMEMEKVDWSPANPEQENGRLER
jgi:hypothetical protein